MKNLLLTGVAVILLSSISYAFGSGNNQVEYGGNSPYYNAQENDYSNDRGGSSPYYNSQNNDYSNYRGGNDSGYNASDNERGTIYGDDNSYRNSNGMIMNK